MIARHRCGADPALLAHVADRGDRRRACGPDRRDDRREHRDPDPHDCRREHGAPDHDEVALRHREPEPGQQPEQRLRRARCRAPTRRADANTPITAASASTEPITCGPLAPIARSKPELAQPLRHEDRERVEDDEAADEQADAGEAEERVVEDREELVDGRAGLVGDDRGRRDLESARSTAARVEHPLQRALRRGRRSCPARTRTLTASKTPGASKTRCAVFGSNAAKLTAPKSPWVPSLNSPTSLNSSASASSRTFTRSPTLKPLRRAVPTSIATSPSRTGRSTRGDPRRADLVAAAPRDPERRRARGLDRGLAVLPDELRVALEEAVGGLDAGDLAHGVDDALGEPLAAAVTVAEGRLAAHDEVHARRVLREQRAERLLQRVREDVRAAHERDAEHDGQRGEGEANPPGEHALDRRPPHRPHPAPGPNGFGHHPRCPRAPIHGSVGLPRHLEHRLRLLIGRGR